MDTIRLTTAQAIVRWLIAQRIEVDGTDQQVFAGAFGLFGHGNVTCLAEALEPVKDRLPTWRGHNEQSMALAAVAFAKARHRQQMMIATASMGPGSTNMITAAAVAHANRLPVLLLSGDTFTRRIADPVHQQVEHFGDPTTSVVDAFKPVTRYWDRIMRPEQIVQSLPQALAVLLDPADCGPVFLALPQDVQAEAYDYPAAFFAPRTHRIRRPAPDPRDIDAAADLLATAERPLLIAGGGVHYSGAVDELTAFARRRGIPVAETVAGKSTLVHTNPNYVGPIGVAGSTSANAVAEYADVVVAVGTRLQDLTTGSRTVFQHPNVRFVAINTARWDAVKLQALPVVGDAKTALAQLDERLGDYTAPRDWEDEAEELTEYWHDYLDEWQLRDEQDPPSYAQVVRVINDLCSDDDYVVAAAGGLPDELTMGWRSMAVGSFDCEHGYSTMGYEIAGAWGARMARGHGDVVAWVGDGSYLLMNSDIHSTVFTGHKVILMICDNGGFASTNHLQVAHGGAEFNNLLASSRHADAARVDFVAHTQAMGAMAEKVASLDELRDAFTRAKAADRTYAIVIDVDPYAWTEGGAWREVAVPEVSDREEVRLARTQLVAERQHQRVAF